MQQDPQHDSEVQKDVPVCQDTASLESKPLHHNIPEKDGKASAKYSEDSKPYHDLAQLQEHFQQLQEQLAKLEPTANPPMLTEEQVQLTNKLQ